MIYRFQDYQLDTDRVELRRNDELQPVEPQVFRLLVHLIEHRDRLVSKDELVDAIWAGRAISDATLSSRISLARQVVGDSGRDQKVIRTLPRRGYRFVATLAGTEVVPPDDPCPAGDAIPQTIRFCSAADGVRLAYSVSGAGRPVVKTMGWLNHLEFDWRSPVFGPVFQSLAANHQLLRYDSRGVGLSERNVADLTYDALFDDLECVIKAARLTRFALFGISLGAALAIDYAARHPDQVSHLVLWGGFSRGRNRRGNDKDAEVAEAFKTLMRHGWGKQSSTFLRMFASLYLPEANEEQIRWWADMQRIATSPENAVRLRETIDDLDVSDKLKHVRAPTLIVHSLRDEVAPFAEARRMASKMPDTILLPLDSANHLVQTQEPGWRRAMDEITKFLSTSGEAR